MLNPTILTVFAFFVRWLNTLLFFFVVVVFFLIFPCRVPHTDQIDFIPKLRSRKEENKRENAGNTFADLSFHWI